MLSRNTLLTLCLACASLISLDPCLVLAQGGTVLHGGVSEQGKLQGQPGKGGPSLSRKDIEQAGDPFGGGGGDGQSSQGFGDETLQAPPEAFRPATVQPPPREPQRGFNLDAETEDFTGQTMPGVQDSAPQQPLRGAAAQQDPTPPPQQPPMQTRAPSTDPDESQAMRLAWDAWHRRIAAAVMQRYNFFAKTAFKYSRAMGARVNYQVTSDGRVINVQLAQQASNPLFNILIVQVVKSLNGDVDLLRFPQGSRRTIVDKSGDFTVNAGQEGFRYTTGDRETIRLR